MDSIESALAAEAGGAGRLELCDNLAEGGTTPSAGIIAVCREQVGIPLFVLIRARGGDFVYSNLEVEAMCRDIIMCRELEVDGVVIGALRSDGRVDLETTARFVETARPMAVTFHRAFDGCRDASRGLEELIELGVDRVLTSGQAATALEGAVALAALVRQAAGRIIVLAGGGVSEKNVAALIGATGVSEVHARGVSVKTDQMQFHNPLVSMIRAVPPEGSRMVTDANRIRRLVELIGKASVSPQR